MMPRAGDLGARLYRGEVSYDFVGKRRLWYGVSAVLILVSVLGLGLRGLNLGVEFSGGAVFTVNQAGLGVDEVTEATEAVEGMEEPEVQTLGEDRVRVRVGDLSSQEANEAKVLLAEELGLPADDVDAQVIGPSWGDQISERALIGIAVFLVLVVAYLSLAFEWKMAAGAIIALFHDIVLTVGIYALVGFEVTPATVTGLLTILGYSLYDTVVVFDKVKENTRGITARATQTISEAANLAVNQTLVRSINTTLVALLPVVALLVVGVGILGAGVIQDLALVLFVGMATGAYSSIFLAAPLYAALKEREPASIALAKRVASRRAADRRKSAERASGATDGADDDPDDDDTESPRDTLPAARAGRRK
ncbi:protein translocase subunit SecF [Allostreptomyces psammosilenae]|uniref:Protein-export membrane protein SecF n=1 Tax=Allostreptomyces psammosilenae TaxID=1892865 RepID=A0A852ZUR4_9ACTN|nr:protein translocase subunit SecF [Allostreptomyces psammosilenae]NYI05020.1 preprotein translocase subunit SecF [Allostreptomyces psammosilenae]